MRKVFIKSLQKLIDIDLSIVRILIEEPLCFREISCNLLENIVYSENDEVIEISKKSMIIYNPYQININDSKILKHLYKKIEKNILENHSDNLANLENVFFNLLDDIIEKDEYHIDYHPTIDISKLLLSVNVNVIEPTYENYIERLIQYLILNKEINSSINIILSFGLLNILTEEETEVLDTFLRDMEITLIDFSFKQKNITSTLIVDEDWCII